MSHQNKLFKKFIKTIDPVVHSAYKKMRNHVSRVKQQAKKNYYQSLFKNSANSSNTWKYVNELIRKQPKVKTNLPLSIKVNEKTITEPEKICNEMNRYFVNIGHKLAEKKKNVNSKNTIKCNSKRQVNSMILSPTGKYEIIEIINSFNEKKAAGHEDIPIILIKRSKFIIADFLARSYNFYMQTGIYPNILKIAKVTAVHKGHKSNESNNYRPISVLSPFNKIFETIIFRRLSKFWDKYKLFTPFQFGFRSGHSTTLAVNQLLESILYQNDQNNLTCAIFIDLSKAFDTVDHQILVQKLEHSGVRGTVKKLIESYLTNRKQFVSKENAKSSLLPITVGVPQGSVLGPFLFGVYINDIANSSKLKTLLYADDTVLFMSHKNPQILESSVSTELKQITSWLNDNKLTINLQKTNYMVFGNHKTSLKLKINNDSLNRARNVRYLGIYIDDKLNWSRQVEHLVKKLSISFGVLCKIHKFVLPKTLQTIYYSLVYSHINYGIINWGNAAQTRLNKLQLIQNKIVKSISQSWKRKIKLLPIYKNLNLLTVKSVYKLEVSKFMYKYYHNQLPLSFSNYFQPNSNIHKYSTRQSYFLPRLNKKKSQKSIKYFGIKTWEGIPKEYKSIKSLRTFAKSCKEHLIKEQEL